MRRQHIAEFLLGFFALPACALFGGLEALLFKASGGKALVFVAVTVLIPIIGALKSRQKTLLIGLLTGLAASVAAYFGFLVRH